jgi:hypothetical protein
MIKKLMLLNMYPMKKLFSVLLILLANIVCAQINENNNLSTVMPANPSAFEFLKYSEVPISKYTGVSNILIPIYNIKSKGLEIPITLTYHSNGFRVNEEAGWTGLGWTLNTGGNIVQIVQGFDDFGSKNNRNLPDIDAIAHIATNGSAPNGAFTTNYANSMLSIKTSDFSHLNVIGSNSQGAPQNQLFPYSLAVGDQDFEPDVFQFNFLGYSGKFILDWETEEFKCLNNSVIKVEKVSNNSQIKIITPEGHQGYFSVKEKSLTISSSSSFQGGASGGYPLLGEITSRVYKLDFIVTSHQDRIDFEYTITPPIKNFLNISRQKISYEDLGIDPLSTGSYNIPGYGMAGSGFSSGETVSTSLSEQSMSFLDKITFNKGVILFETSSRSDLVGSRKLDNIILKENENSNVEINKITFSYDYFIGHSNGTSISNSHSDGKSYIEKSHRLRLNSVKEIGIPAYTFNYNSTQLPIKTSLARDYWGYYNGYLNNASMYVNLYRFDYNLTGPMSSYTPEINNNRSSSLNHSKAAVLEKIIYPTGGYSLFEYELNSFSNYKIPNYNFTNSTAYNSNHTSYGGGLRINRIKNYDSNHQIINRKLYTYSNGKLMSPILFFNKTYIPNHEYVKAYSSQTGAISAHARGYKIRQSTNSFLSPSSSASGSFVGYDKVVETLVSKNDENNSIGTIEFFYENNIDEGIINTTYDEQWNVNGFLVELGLPTRKANKPSNGSLKKEIVKDIDGKEVKKIIYTYNNKIRSFHKTGIKFGPLIKSDLAVGYAGTLIKTYLLGTYPIRGIDTYLTRTKTTFIEKSDSIVKVEDYLYNDNNLLKEKTLLNSDGNIIKTSYGYYYNLIGSEKVEQNGKTSKMIGYSYNGNKIKKISNNLPFAGFVWTGIQDFLNISNSIISITYEYDGDSNIVKMFNTQSDLETRYIWDYYGKNLLIKIEGTGNSGWPSSSNINAVINASQNYENHENLDQTITQLRANTNDKHITSYTHYNLIGVRSIINPQGVITFFEYDDLNRLKFIKDKDGNILEESKYNYKN